MYETIDQVLIRESKEDYISIQDKRVLRRKIFNSIRRLDVLQDLIEDPYITEIMVNGTDKIFIEKNGSISLSNKSFASKQKLENIIQQIVAQSNRVINESNPIDGLSDGSE